MSGPEQVLFLVAVPLGIVAVIWALTAVGGPQARRRYRPGRPFEFTPVWYLANHRPENGAGAADRPALTAGTGGTDGGLRGTRGGASDRW